MKKIVFGITSLTLGGAERVLIDLANKLVEDYDITIFTIYNKGVLEKELNKNVHIESIYNKTYKELSKKEKVIIPLNILFNKKKIFRKYIENKNYDVQIAFLEGPITRLFSVKSKSAKVKKIAWVHNDMSKVFGKNIKSKIKRIIDRNAYEKYDTIVFVSRDNLDKFNKVYDDILLPEEKVIHNYLDSERIIKLSEEKHENIFNKNEVNILQVSRLVEQKAIDRLIDAHTKLINEGIKHHIYIIGEGPLKQKLDNKVKENKVEKTFTLLGAKENPYTYMKDCDIFALFSNFEGYPMVVEEAKILKKYILVTNTSAREVIEDYPKYSKIAENSQEGIENVIKFSVKNKKQILQENIEYIYTNSKIIDKIKKIVE